MPTRTCPMCNHTTTDRWCCGLDLSARRETVFRMTPDRIRGLRALAHGTKGLDEETFRMYLARAGVQHTRDLTREQFDHLRAELGRLPNAKRRGMAA